MQAQIAITTFRSYLGKPLVSSQATEAEQLRVGALFMLHLLSPAAQEKEAHTQSHSMWPWFLSDACESHELPPSLPEDPEQQPLQLSTRNHDAVIQELCTKDTAKAPEPSRDQGAVKLEPFVTNKLAPKQGKGMCLTSRSDKEFSPHEMPFSLSTGSALQPSHQQNGVKKGVKRAQAQSVPTQKSRKRKSSSQNEKTTPDSPTASARPSKCHSSAAAAAEPPCCGPATRKRSRSSLHKPVPVQAPPSVGAAAEAQCPLPEASAISDVPHMHAAGAAAAAQSELPQSTVHASDQAVPAADAPTTPEITVLVTSGSSVLRNIAALAPLCHAAAAPCHGGPVAHARRTISASAGAGEVAQPTNMVVPDIHRAATVSAAAALSSVVLPDIHRVTTPKAEAVARAPACSAAPPAAQLLHSACLSAALADVELSVKVALLDDLRLRFQDDSIRARMHEQVQPAVQRYTQQSSSNVTSCSSGLQLQAACMVFMSAHANDTAAQGCCFDHGLMEDFLQTWEVFGCLVDTQCEGRADIEPSEQEEHSGSFCTDFRVLKPLLLGLGHLAKWHTLPSGDSEAEHQQKAVAVHAVRFEANYFSCEPVC